MNEVIKSIDWAQLGPLTVVMLCIMIIMLCVSPFIFKWLYRREDASAEARKRSDDREMLKDKMLLESLSALGSNLAKASEIIEGVGKRVCDHVSATGKEVMVEITRLRAEIDDRKQTQIQAELQALREHQLTAGAPSTRLPHPSTPGS